MSEDGIAHQNNHDIDQPDITNLLINDFSSTFHGWRDLYPTSLSIFTKFIGCDIIDDLYTPIYTIPKYFVDLPSNISPRIFVYGYKWYKWYQDVFVSRDMLQHDCRKPCWKERFIDGLPLIFAQKVK